MEIIMPRGDYRPVKFKVSNKNETDFELKFDEIYFTVKTNAYTKTMLFQKKLSLR